MEKQAKSSAVKPLPEADVQKAIQCRAEEIYVRSGRIPGRDLENWAQAERQIHSEVTAKHEGKRRAIVVKVSGVRYVGEYSQANSGSYVPGEFGSGMPVPVRFDGDKMFVKRPNGKELETRIVKKSG